MNYLHSLECSLASIMTAGFVWNIWHEVCSKRTGQPFFISDLYDHVEEAVYSEWPPLRVASLLNRVCLLEAQARTEFPDTRYAGTARKVYSCCEKPPFIRLASFVPFSIDSGWDRPLAGQTLIDAIKGGQTYDPQMKRSLRDTTSDLLLPSIQERLSKNLERAQIDRSHTRYEALPLATVLKSSGSTNWHIGERKYFEDRDVVTSIYVHGQMIHLYAVIDGHGGSDVANSVQNKLATILLRLFEEEKDLGDASVYNALKKLGPLLDEELLRLEKVPQGGATLCVCCVINENCYTANIGDSRAALLEPQGSLYLSVDADVDKAPFDRDVIMKRGAFRYDGRLYSPEKSINMARALGDFDFLVHIDGVISKMVSPVAKITRVFLTEDSFLVIATDGLWDVISLETVTKAIECWKKEGLSAEEMSFKLCAAAAKSPDSDNVTVLVLDVNTLLASTSQSPSPSEADSSSQLSGTSEDSQEETRSPLEKS